MHVPRGENIYLKKNKIRLFYDNLIRPVSFWKEKNDPNQIWLSFNSINTVKKFWI